MAMEGALRLLALTYAAAINHVAVCCGCIFLLQAFHGSSEFRWAMPTNGDGSIDWAGCVEAARLLFGNFLVPFSHTAAAAAFPSKMIDFRVLGFWLPSLLGGFICSTALLGHLALKFRRAAFVLPHVLLAVVQLMWQLELEKVMQQVAVSEPLSIAEAGSADLKSSMQYAMFEVPYEAFTSVYTSQRCAATLPKSHSEPVRLECTGDGVEGKLITFAVGEFCRAWHARSEEEVEAFGKRVDACGVVGRQAKLLPERSRPREVVFCRCRAALYDSFRVIAGWMKVGWAAQLLGLCLVLYFAVEPNLAKMDPVQRREILGFAVLGIALLVARVTVFAEHFDDYSDEL